MYLIVAVESRSASRQSEAPAGCLPGSLGAPSPCSCRAGSSCTSERRSLVLTANKKAVVDPQSMSLFLPWLRSLSLLVSFYSFGSQLSSLKTPGVRE